jgi:hypothetical protein
VVTSAAVTAVCAAIGWLPTVRLAGPGAAEGLLAGCAISWLACVSGAVLFARLTGANVPGGLAELAKLGLRFGAVVLFGVIGAVLARRGFWPLRPMLVWIALSYLPLLGLDIGFALGAERQTAGSAGPVQPPPEDTETR